MKGYFSIGEAAKIVHTTSETLRHYDRIGLQCSLSSYPAFYGGTMSCRFS